VTGATETFDYTVDKKLKKIIFQSGSIPASGTNNVVVDYSYRAERPVVRTNDSSVADIGRTIKKRFTLTDIQSVDDAERRAQNLLAIFSEPFLSTRVMVSPSVVESFDIQIGQAIRVIDERLGFDVIMTVKKKKSRFPENDVELELGDREFRVASNEYDTAYRLKRLEEEQSKAGTFVVQIIDSTHTEQTQVRDFAQSNRTIQANILYWNSTSQGTWNSTFNWGDGTEDSFVDQSIQHSQDIYDEDFNDTVFKAVATTATWGSSGSVTFTSGQIAESSAIDFDNSTITQATLTSTEVSGSFTYELTADGSTFETVTSGTRHFFTATGTDLRWRATENAASAGEISNLKVEGFH